MPDTKIFGSDVFRPASSTEDPEEGEEDTDVQRPGVPLAVPVEVVEKIRQSIIFHPTPTDDTDDGKKPCKSQAEKKAEGRSVTAEVPADAAPLPPEVEELGRYLEELGSELEEKAKHADGDKKSD